MGMDKKKKNRLHLYIPWFTSDEAFYEDEETNEDSWIGYLRRNLKHPVGEESPFPYSSWSYTRHDSPFEADDEGQLEKKSDTTLHDEITNILYQDPEIDASNINTIVLNGIVILMGTVKTLLEKNKAEALVRTLAGVWNVKNSIKIEELKRRSISGMTL